MAVKIAATKQAKIVGRRVLEPTIGLGRSCNESADSALAGAPQQRRHFMPVKNSKAATDRRKQGMLVIPQKSEIVTCSSSPKPVAVNDARILPVLYNTVSALSVQHRPRSKPEMWTARRG